MVVGMYNVVGAFHENEQVLFCMCMAYGMLGLMVGFGWILD